MITKLAAQYFTGANCLNVLNTRGYNKMVLEMNTAGTNLDYFYVLRSSDDRQPSVVNLKIREMYSNGCRYGNIDRIVPVSGSNRYVFDVSIATSVQLVLHYKDGEEVQAVTSIAISLSHDAICASDYRQEWLSFVNHSGTVNVNCTKYRTALVHLTVSGDNVVTFNARGTKNGSFPTLATPNIGFYVGGLRILNSVRFGAGDYSFIVDVSEYSNAAFVATGVDEGQADSFDIILDEAAPKIHEQERVSFDTQSAIQIDCREFNSLKLYFNVESAIAYSVKDMAGNYVPTYYNGALIMHNFQLPVGTSEFVVDTRNVDSVVLFKGSGLVVEPSFDKVSYNSSLTEIGLCEDFNPFVIGSGKQLDFEVKTSTGNYRLYLEGSNDDFATSENIPLLRVDVNKAESSGLVCNGSTYRIFANIEGYSAVRFRQTNFLSNLDKTTIYNCVVSDDYVGGRKIGYHSEVAFPFLRGYRYLKISFKPSGYRNGTMTTASIKGCTAHVAIYEDGSKLTPAALFDRAMKLAHFPVTDLGAWYLYGTPTSGGYVMDFGRPLAGGISLRVATSARLTEYEAAAVFDVECYTEAPKGEDTGLVKKWERADYTVYRLPSNSVKRDVLNNDILEWEDNNLIYWHGGYKGVRYDIPFGSDNVAHFVTGEKINFAYLLPFAGVRSRVANVGKILNFSRIVVFTDTRVFHNFPSRGDNAVPSSDLFMFDESAVFNRFKWLPVNDLAKVDSIHKYFPVLKDYDYAQFDGRIATSGADDPYGNGGLPAGYAYQDMLKTSDVFWRRLAYSNMTKSQRFCAFGEYNARAGGEPIVMVTTNGGKDWYVHAYFAATDFYNCGIGSVIDLTPITNIAGAYVSGSLRMCRKRFNVPSAEDKEPATPFIIEAADKSLVTGFSTDNDGNCIVTVADDVDYDGVHPIVYFENVSAASGWNYICNEGVTASSPGNGIFFRVEKVSANQYKLFGDMGNPNTGEIVCRHIHAVNAIEAGILVSTGESYAEGQFEGGFLYVMEQTRNNGSDPVPASNNLPWENITRLTSTIDGVNRASGAFLFSDNADPTLLYVSDESFVVGNTHKRYAPLPEGRTGMLPLTPGGIYVGKLSDVDEQRKFKCVCETKSTVIGLTENHGHFAADGHGNSLCLSKDGFDWTIEIDDGDNSMVNGVDNLGNIYFGNKVAVFK